ncbi:MAG: c-type cytochrome biogenesis protein CcmF [marine bacterium B5-7]|nr:MAG: c-type cytochrome biogenesis protein CcmF [marine bacterium B5-7]
MIAEVGQFSLILSAWLMLLAAGIGLFARGDAPTVIPALSRNLHVSTLKPIIITACSLIFMSYVCLTIGFACNDFSIAYVAANSNTHLPWFYRLVAVWGAHEGSMLLWITCLAIWITFVCRYSRNLPADFVARMLGTLSAITLGFLCFILFTSNPFLRTLPYVPLNGHDLNPLLQDPGLIIHPPLLYMGYVGFAVAFSFAIAALLTQRLESTWAKWTRPWTLMAWCFLTAGIVLGSWWSYHELGWGGWWFWDPVENASFMPWLIGTALIHSLIVTQKHGLFKYWTLLLAILTFSLSLLGTFLVRSGVLTSVHAFAVDPRRGAFMLVYLLIVVGGGLGLLAWRQPTLTAQAPPSRMTNRSSLLLFNNIFMVVATLSILLGTLYPLLIDALHWGKISVGPPYFNTVFVPIAAIMFVFMGIGPLCRWQETHLSQLLKTLLKMTFISLVIAALVQWMCHPIHAVRILLGVIMAVWLVSGALFSLRTARHQMGMLIAHIGVAICIIGVTFASIRPLTKDVRLDPRDTAKLGGYTFQLLGTREKTGPNYTALVADILVRRHHQWETLLSAEKRHYHPSDVVMTRAAIDAGVTRDIYIALADPQANGGWTLRLYIKPFVRWIWVGGDLMVLGGLLACWLQRRRRKTHA